MNTPQKITNLLNRKDWTVQELATELGISRNSAHLQVGKLEAAGIIEKVGRRKQAGAGKPAYHYRTVAGSEDSFSTAYKPVLVGLVQAINANLSEKERLALLESAGRTVARSAGLGPSGDLLSDIERSVETVNSLGAMAELTRKKKRPHVNCYSCPVGTLVHADPLVCQLVAAFFSEATGKTITVRCRHEGPVVCGFSVDED